MLTRGADGRLYRIGPNGAVVVTEEQNLSRGRVPAQRAMDNGASADLHFASADLHMAKM
ncbi:MAG: hypothetical protein ACT6Q8_19885 [Niveispirillum sp.]|jgi:hypothetical protein|uniref:hypothetical protein n=1 Tax=Niveispirillum sp. TaxID=1917217 RepID=UPI0012E1C7BC|nr:hypothetical protein [Niveispirillum sp.]